MTETIDLKKTGFDFAFDAIVTLLQAKYGADFYKHTQDKEHVVDIDVRINGEEVSFKALLDALADSYSESVKEESLSSVKRLVDERIIAKLDEAHQWAHYLSEQLEEEVRKGWGIE